MITVKIPQDQLDNIRKSMRSISQEKAKEVQNVVKKATVEVDGEVKELLNQNGTGRIYSIPTMPGQKGGQRRTHRASKEGEPPAKQYGFLVGGIRWEILGHRMTGRVRSQARYSRALEFGFEQNNLKPRPFMRPAVERVQPKFNQAIRKIFK